MKNLTLFIAVLLVLFIASTKSVAQQNTSADSIVNTVSTEKQSYGLVSTNYNSNIVFLGRKSLSNAPYLSAFAGYYHTYDDLGYFGVVERLWRPFEDNFRYRNFV